MKTLDLKEAKRKLKLYMSQPDRIRALNLAVLTLQHIPLSKFLYIN